MKILKWNDYGCIILSLFILFAASACKEETQPESESSVSSNKCKIKAHNTSAIDAISTGLAGLNPCAIRNGKVKCWGENADGQLGLGDSFSRGDDPDEMGNCLDEVSLGSKDAVSVAVSNTANRCALFTDGSVKCWGYNTVGNLGLGDTVDRIHK